MPATRSKTTQAQKPTFVFKGTIKKLKSATMKGVPVDERTLVVTVNQVIEAPPALFCSAFQGLQKTGGNTHANGYAIRQQGRCKPRLPFRRPAAALWLSRERIG